ncbi:MAG: hypothetical protein QW356_06040 [Candidatus Hadarchaeales archaeon]
MALVKIPLSHGEQMVVEQLGLLQKGPVEMQVLGPEAIEWVVQYIKWRQEHDYDCIVAITGREGEGKSTLAAHLVWRLGLRTPEVCFTGKELVRRLEELPPKQVLWYDEVVEGMYTRDAMTRLNKILAKIFTAGRILGHVIIICLPRLMDLDVGVRRRVIIWLHTYTISGRRGWADVYISREKSPFAERGKELRWDPQFVFRFHSFPHRGSPEEEAQKKFWSEYIQKKMAFVRSLLKSASD